MTDRFDLEQKIMDCSRVVEDLELLFGRTCEEQMDLNEVTNITLGLKVLYSHRFQELFDTFEALIRERKFISAPMAEGFDEEEIPAFLRKPGGTE